LTNSRLFIFVLLCRQRCLQRRSNLWWWFRIIGPVRIFLMNLAVCIPCSAVVNASNNIFTFLKPFQLIKLSYNVLTHIFMRFWIYYTISQICHYRWFRNLKWTMRLFNILNQCTSCNCLTKMKFRLDSNQLNFTFWILIWFM
jgi:hypothetical protein